jgi:hypothetical protein
VTAIKVKEDKRHIDLSRGSDSQRIICPRRGAHKESGLSQSFPLSSDHKNRSWAVHYHKHG